MAAYIDLSEKHGHRNDHGFACGAEFNVKIRRRVDVPDFVREQLSQGAIDAIWWEEAEQAKDSLREALSRRYKWIGEMSFVGRGPGWLAIEDTACGSRNWDTIGKVVDQYLKNFVKSMESPRFWRDVKGVEKAAASPAVSHATMKTPKKSTPKKSKTWHIFETGRATGDRWVAGPYMTKKAAETLAARYMSDPPGRDSLRRSGVYIVKDHGP